MASSSASKLEMMSCRCAARLLLEGGALARFLVVFESVQRAEIGDDAVDIPLEVRLELFAELVAGPLSRPLQPLVGRLNSLVGRVGRAVAVNKFLTDVPCTL